MMGAVSRPSNGDFWARVHHVLDREGQVREGRPQLLDESAYPFSAPPAPSASSCTPPRTGVPSLGSVRPRTRPYYGPSRPDAVRARTARCGIGENMDAALPPGSGGVIAVYDSGGAPAVDKALANAVKKSVAQIDGTSARDLKAGLAEAQAGMGG
jgi:hypothetical protein